MADRAEVDADLVGAAGLEPHAEQRWRGSSSSSSKCVPAVARRRRCRATAARSRRSRPIGASIVPARDRGPPSRAPGSRARPAPPHAPLQGVVRLVGPRDDEQPGGAPVEAVDDPRTLRPPRPTPPSGPAPRRACRRRAPPPAGRPARRACRRPAGARPPTRWWTGGPSLSGARRRLLGRYWELDPAPLAAFEPVASRAPARPLTSAPASTSPCGRRTRAEPR